MIHLSTASHKIERSERAKKRLTDWVCLGSAANETVDPFTTSCRLIPDMSDTIEWRRLCRQTRTVREAVTKLLGMIEGETERLPEKCDMSHLATGTNCTLAVEMDDRTRNIHQRSTACALHNNRGIIPNEIHHDGRAQQTHFTKRHPADGTNLLLKLGHGAGVKRVMA